jgi:hypothetical protein
MNRYWVARGLKIVLFVVLVAAAAGFVVMSLWNWLMPPLFGWRELGFWQALGLLILSRLLLGGWRGRWGYGMHWRQRMAARWEQMTPDEREKFRQGMRARCGHFGGPSSEAKPPAAS